MAILTEIVDDYDRTHALVQLLVSRATGGPLDEDNFLALREYFVNHPQWSSALPRWFIAVRSGAQFWQFIKQKFPSYAERREFIWSEFDSLLQHCESNNGRPADDDITEALKVLNSEAVDRVWRKTLYRLPEDPDGAITVARTLLEEVCKHILEDSQIAFDRSDDLNVLYRRVAQQLKLAPEQHADQVFKQILSGCMSIVNGLAAIRNQYGDAHGQGRSRVRVSERHAALAANLSGSMAMYLLETFSSRQQT